MYKETVVRKKIPTILTIIILLAVSIITSCVIEKRQICKNEFSTYFIILLVCMISLLIIMHINKYSIKYKYSIIQDELIIYKIKGSRQEVMESIKIKDIQSLENMGKIISRFKTIFCRKYSCLNVANDLYMCLYDNGRMKVRFYFEPSYKLISRLNWLRTKQVF